MNLLKELHHVLRSNPNFIGEDNQLLRAKITEAIDSLDDFLIRGLLNNKNTRKAFFKQIDNVLILNQQRLNWIINSTELLEDSYTAYRNNIGLVSDGQYIRTNTNVVLDFPYKDGVLVGGQEKDEQKRKEIIYHEILGYNQIHNLRSPKVLGNAKRYTDNGVEENIVFNDNDNLIIKGNNYAALNSILDKYRGKIKLIYIDPPYNTGTDSFQYNDNFNHSTWLTFMKNRLVIAKELLRNDGVIAIQTDYHESSYLRVLMDEIFLSENYISEVTVQMSTASGPKMSHIESSIPKLKDSILIYKKNSVKIFEQPMKPKEKWDKEYSKILMNFTIEDRVKLKEYIKEKDFNNILNIVQKTRLSTLTKEYPNEKSNIEWLKENAWRIVADKQNTGVDNLLSKTEPYWTGDISAIQSKSGNVVLFRTDKDFGKDTRVEIVFADDNLKIHAGDIWTDISTSGGFSDEGGVNFPTAKKPEKLLNRIIRMFTRKDDIVLDYFMGSATTQAVALKNERKFIGIEQMDYIKKLSVERLKNVIRGEQTGISKEVNWQGGGSFVYCELLEDNKYLIDKILTSDENNIGKLKDKIYNSEQIVPYILKSDLQKYDAKFKKLSLEEQQNALIELIDKNKIYINYSSIDDEDYMISSADKTFSDSFYKGVEK